MGRQIIKQPNGLYCLYSSIVDNVVDGDLTKEDLINAFLEFNKKEIVKNVSEIIESLENGGKPYLQFTKSFDDMIELISEIHGKKASKKILKALS